MLKIIHIFGLCWCTLEDCPFCIRLRACSSPFSIGFTKVFCWSIMQEQPCSTKIFQLTLLLGLTLDFWFICLSAVWCSPTTDFSLTTPTRKTELMLKPPAPWKLKVIQLFPMLINTPIQTSSRHTSKDSQMDSKAFTTWPSWLSCSSWF